MAKNKGLPAITLLGQAASGKTNLLAGLLNHDQALQDLQEGRNPVVNAGLVAQPGNDVEDEKAFSNLSRHFVSMLEGAENLLEGTNAVRRYGVRLFYDEPAEKEAVKSGRWLPLLGGRTKADQVTHSFEIVDGRGADAAPSEVITDADKDAVKRRQDYRDGMDESSGFVLFMPLMSDDEGSEAIISQHFLAELSKAIERKANPTKSNVALKQVALCFTKCERAFVEDGVYAFDEARDPRTYEDLLRDNAVLSTFRSVLAESLREDAFDVRVFPVSTYGFVHDSGAPNFYPWPSAPGLLTRAVNEFDHYNDGEIPDYKDHFPFPVQDDQAKSMWRPFNIAPPILYALTGRITGPISFSAQEAMDFISA